MSEGCNNNCHSCQINEDCGNKKIKTLDDVNIKKIICILGAKGGIGKSTITSLLAIELINKGYKVGILDGDLSGSSISKIFNLDNQTSGDEKGIFPKESKKGLKIISMNMMLEDEETPILWRSHILNRIFMQFYNEVHWGKLDYLLLDMPTGIDDKAIIALSQIPIDGSVIISNHTKLAIMSTAKTINMAKAFKTKIYGLIENMNYDNNQEDNKEDIERLAQKYQLDIISNIPFDKTIMEQINNGNIEDYKGDYLKDLIKKVEEENE